MFLLSWESHGASNNLAAKGLLRQGLYASQKEGLAGSGSPQTQPAAPFQPSPSSRASTWQNLPTSRGRRRLRPRPLRAGRRSHVRRREPPRGLPSPPLALPAHGATSPLAHAPRRPVACLFAACLLPVCILLSPSFPTRSEAPEKQRRAETPSLPQEVSSLKFRRVTEERRSSGGKNTDEDAEGPHGSALRQRTSPRLRSPCLETSTGFTIRSFVSLTV